MCEQAVEIWKKGLPQVYTKNPKRQGWKLNIVSNPQHWKEKKRASEVCSHAVVANMCTVLAARGGTRILMLPSARHLSEGGRDLLASLRP